MKTFFSALKFLTIIPARTDRDSAKGLAGSLVYFPIVGLMLGLVLAGANTLLLVQFGSFASTTIIVIFLAFLTGGLHLDGLADTADAVFSGKDRPRMLEIMRDPHIGAMGVIVLVSVILLKIAFLSSIEPQDRNAALVLMCVLSRWSMVLSIHSFPYARQDGKAKVFMDGVDKKILFTAAFITLLTVFAVSKSAGFISFVAVCAFTLIMGRYMKKRIGGVTGDTIGAVSELNEVVVLICTLTKSVLENLIR